MPNASVAGVPSEVIQKWTTEFRKLKAEAKAKGIEKLPQKALQHTYNGVTYTGKWSGKNSVSWPQASYEAKVEGSRSRKGEHQKIQLSSIEQKLVDQKYADANFLSNLMGQKIVVDHVIPIGQKGFSNDPNNLQLLTDKTNSRKSDSTEWYNAALEESQYLSDLAFKESSAFNFDGSSAKLNVNAIMTQANMPALGGFQDAKIGPYQTPQRTEEPAQATLQETYTLPKQPIEPKRNLTQQLYESSQAVLENAVPTTLAIGAGAFSFIGSAVRFATGGGF